ncbi:hypothetical protein [Haloferula sargassicola]|uniref:Uncharacterized protein n=1 Tax=Haloferula sargassicola TaxID=490096 RepID=A0ABP9ULX6_9BACT
MILPDTLAPLPVAEDAGKREIETEFVAESVVRQLLVGPMSVLPQHPAEEMADFAGRSDLGEKAPFRIRRDLKLEPAILEAGTHPAFAASERRAAAPRPRGPQVQKADRTSVKGLAIVLGSGIAAAVLMTAVWISAMPSDPEPTLQAPAVRIDRAAAAGGESDELLLVRSQWETDTP